MDLTASACTNMNQVKVAKSYIEEEVMYTWMLETQIIPTKRETRHIPLGIIQQGKGKRLLFYLIGLQDIKSPPRLPLLPLMI